MKLFYTALALFFFSAVNAQNLDTWTQVGQIKFPDNPSVQTTGMGRVSELVYHPSDSNTLFAVSSSGGLWRSSNEGQTWRSLTDKLPRTQCASVCINRLRPATIYLGTGDADYNSTGMGVWKSHDGGVTWFQSNTGMGNKLVSKILMHPTDTNLLIAACSDGIYKSTDRGNNWIKKTTVTASYRALVMKARAGTQTLYAATDGNFYRSVDMGENWTQHSIFTGLAPAGIKIGVSPADSQVLYCVVWKSTGNRFGGLYKSVNDGNSFTLQSDTPNILGYSGDGSSADGQGAYNLCIGVDPTNINVIYVGAINIWKSVNAGASWTMKSHWAYGVHADKHCFVFSPFNPNKLIITHDGGLDRTNNGGDNWLTLSDGLTASEYYKMGQSRLRKEILIGGLQDNGLNLYRNGTFYTIRGGDWTGDFEFDYKDTNILYFNGGNRRYVSGPEENINGTGKYQLHPTDTNVMFYGTNEVYRTSNLKVQPSTNVSWTAISSALGGTSTPTIQAMACSKSNPSALYLARNDGSLFRSDNALSASPAYTMLTGKPAGTISQILLHARDQNFVVIVIGQNIYRSGDKGVTWKDITLNLPSMSIIKILVDEYSADTVLYAVNALGIYYTKRFLPYWSSFATTFPTIAPITDMEIYRDSTSLNDSRLRISTFGRGIWQTDLFRNTAIRPTADFNAFPVASLCSGYYILNDISTGRPQSRRWQVSPSTGWTYLNGTDSTVRNPEIRFTAPGNYIVTLTVTNGQGSSVKSFPIAYSALPVAAACAPNTSNLGGYTIGVQRFELNTIDKSSSYTTNTNPNIEDYTCQVNTTLRPGATYIAALTNGSAYNENARVYLDLNNNGTFESTEQVATFTSGKGRRTTTLPVPANAPILNSYLRLRVISDYNAVTGPCGTLAYGQAEDYAVLLDTVRPAVTLNMPKPTVHQAFTVTFALNKYVVKFDSTALNVQNGILSNFAQTGPLTYSATVQPISNGIVKVNVLAGKLADLAGNTNLARTDSTTFFLGFTSYTFPGISVKDSLTTTTGGGRVDVVVPYGTSLAALAARFTLPGNATAKVASVIQQSDSTINDFSSVVTYQVTSADLLITRSWPVYVTFAPNKACSLLQFGISNPALQGNITYSGNGGTVQLVLPFGSSKNNLTGIFQLSDSASAFIGGVKQQSGVTVNNYTTPVTYTIVAQDTAYKCYYQVQVSEGLSNLCNLLSFSIQNPPATGLIAGNMVTVNVPYGTDKSALVAAFTLSDSAAARVNGQLQTSGSTVNNFTDTLRYVITAQDGTTSKTYPVKVHTSPNHACNLLSFALTNPAVQGIITPSPGGGQVNLTVPFGTDVSALVAVFTISDSAVVKVNGITQQSGMTVNAFTTPLFYQVISQSGQFTKTYEVTVQITPNDSCELLSYQLVNPQVAGTIIPATGGGTVDLNVSPGLNLSSLVAAFTLSDSAVAKVNNVIQVSGITANNYQAPFNLVVTAQNGSQSKTYLVKITLNTGINQTTTNGTGLYPNPADDYVLFNCLQCAGTVHLVLRNVVGQQLGTFYFQNSNAPNGFELDLRSYPAGVYLLQYENIFQQGGIRFVKK